ncbi:MAG TPA: hypothetical protein VF157_12830, partial [Chloroflexota bacterium]
MRTSFVHLAGTRLGFRDPADPTVFERVAKQFDFAIDFALDQRASFVLFGGNLFDGPDLQPDTLQVAIRGLRRLAEKNVSAIAIRGQRELWLQPAISSWYDMLSREGLLSALEPAIRPEQMELRRWERRDGIGSYADLGRCRVLGLGYHGSMAGPLLQALAKAIAA